MHKQPKQPYNVFWTPQATVSVHELPPKVWKATAYCKKRENLGSTQPMRSDHIAWPHMGFLAALLKS